MIIRKQNDSFIMIEQHHHAHISKEIITHWKGHFLNNDSMVILFYTLFKCMIMVGISLINNLFGMIK